MEEERHHNENAGSMRWLLTYADMITLLMTFFIILYAFSKTDVAKYEEIAATLRSALNGGPAQRGLPSAANNALVHLSPVAVPTSIPKTESASVVLAELAQQANAALQRVHAGALVYVSPTSVDIRFQGNTVYFASASARLTPTFRRALRALAPLLKPLHYEIRIEGFTNDLPLHSLKYPTAWELSAARAIHVLRYLTEVCGVPPHLVEADAFGQWHPRYPNNSPLNLARNRSVDIVVTDQPPVGLDQGGPDLPPDGIANVP